MDTQTQTITLAALLLTAMTILGSLYALLKSHKNVTDLATAIHTIATAIISNPTIITALQNANSGLPASIKLDEADLIKLAQLIVANTPTPLPGNVKYMEIPKSGATNNPDEHTGVPV